ncbi:hypothetical protein HanRHA438_Chr05g0236521 [Helianthus annuus]|nr:hypothetical protein HanRHA438_Chr05g0236521 [Helianthus annuus]
MDAREWNASMDRIESMLFEMIGLLKNESRRWATSPIFSKPPPISAPVPPSPAPEPLPTTTAIIPATKFTTFDQLAAPKPALNTSPSPTSAVAQPPRQVSSATPAPKSALKLQTPPPYRASSPSISAPKRATLPQSVAPKTLSLPEPGASKIAATPTSFAGHNFISLVQPTSTAKREWRPLWSHGETALYVIVRLEWRPPWSIRSFALRTRRVRVGWIVTCPLAYQFSWFLNHLEVVKARGPCSCFVHGVNHSYL